MVPEVLPLVTVVTPVYNREDYLEEVILSVLGQDYPNIEFIVLDDGSTDGTLQVIWKYRERLRWESHANMGQTRTVNKGFSMAKGEIVGVVNSDDPLLPGAIRGIVAFMRERPDALVVYPDWNQIDQRGEIIEHIRTEEFNYIDMIRRHHCMPGPGSFFRRSVLENLQGWDSQFRYLGDFDFWLRAGLLGPFARIPETLATFRLHPTGATISGQGTLMGEEHIRLTKKIYNLSGLPNGVRKVRREAFSSAHFIAGIVCGPEPTWEKRLHFLKALGYCPWKYLGEYADRRSHILPAILGNAYGYSREAWKRLSLKSREKDER